MVGILAEGLVDERGILVEEVADLHDLVLFDVVVEEVLLRVEGLAVAHRYLNYILKPPGQ